jgi:uncharacterized membrane protein YkoI
VKKTRMFVLAGVTAALLVAGAGVALASNGDDDRPVPTPVASTGPAAGPAAGQAPAIDRAQAERIALDHVGGGRITDDSELEWEHGALVWEVEVNDDRDLDVDATTGQVTRDELDD